MNRFISLGEVRLGLRLIVKQPILSVTIILALATGICLATMGFTFRDELVNSTLPYQAGDGSRASMCSIATAAASISTSSATTHSASAPTSFEHVGAVGRPAVHDRRTDRRSRIRFAAP